MKCPLCSSSEKEIWVALPGDFLYYTCPTCKLIWLDEARRPTREKEEQRYRTHKNDVTNSDYIAHLNRTALPVAKLVAPGALGLDYGCGPTEGMREALRPYDVRVVSYDPIFFPHEQLLKNRYDFLLCSEAAEHFFYPGEEFARMQSLLKEGGILGVSSQLAVPREKFAQWNYRRDYTHVVFYQEETVHWIARKFGWKLLQLANPIWIYQSLSSGG